MDFLGDFPEDFTTVPVFFTTHDSNGAAVAPLTAFEADDVKIYKDGSNAQKTSTNGLTMTSPFDGIVGLHCLLIDTSNDTGDAAWWVAGHTYTVILNPDTETVNGQAPLKVLGNFTLAMNLRSTTVGRTLDVTATGAAGIDWGNVENLTTVNALSSTTIASTQKVDVETIKTNPVVNGGTVTFPTNSTIATTTGAVGSVTGAVGSVSGNVTGSVGSVAGNVSGTINGLTATALKDFFDTDSTTTYASAVAGSVVKEIADNGGSLTAADVADAVWEEAIADHDGTAGSTAEALSVADTPTASAIADEVQTRTIAAVTLVNGLAANVITAASIASDAITAAKIANGAIDAATFATGALDAVWSTGTRSLTVLDEDSTTLDLDATIRAAVGLASANLDTQLDALPTAAENATAVWGAGTRVLTAGTNIVLAKGVGVTGFNDLSAAQVNTEADTAISDAALATAASLATVAGYIDTEVAAILADTNELQTDWANGGRLDNILDARASQTSVDDLPTNAELATALGTADDAVLTAIAALPTADENADALLDRDMAAGADTGSETTRTVRQALRFLRNKWAVVLDVLTVYAEDDTTPSWTATVTTDSGAQPIVSNDPAST